MERDYSKFITNPSSKKDERPFWLRLLTSLRPSVFVDYKKEAPGKDPKRVIGIKIEGGTEF